MSELEQLQLFIEAARKGDDRLLKKMLNSNPDLSVHANGSEALCMAAKHGHVQSVELLIDVSDPNARLGEAMKNAINGGHTECVELLIPVTDVKRFSSVFLQLACSKQHTDIVDLLYPVSDPQAALNNLKQRQLNDVAMFLERKMAEEEKAVLLDNVDLNKPQASKKKI